MLSEFQGTPQVRLIKLQSIRREYEDLRMNEGDDIKAFTKNLIDLENMLSVHGEEKLDYQIVQKILMSLPKKFDSIVDIPMKHNIWTYGEEYYRHTNEAQKFSDTI